ncbi:MAG: phage tail protein [Actinomycetota bacterium]
MSRVGLPGLPTSRPLAEALPAVLRTDDMTASFVDGLDEVLAPVLLTLDNLNAYIDPETAPIDFVAWLAAWFGVEIDPSWDETRSRRTIDRIAKLQQRRGTADALGQLVEALTGGEVEVDDGGGVWTTFDPGAAPEGEARTDVRVTVTGGESGSQVPTVIQSFLPPSTQLRFTTRLARSD